MQLEMWFPLTRRWKLNPTTHKHTQQNVNLKVGKILKEKEKKKKG
jgi:hypothetical protein